MKLVDRRSRFAVALALLVLSFWIPNLNAEETSATVPIEVDHGRITVEVEIAAPGGVSRRARAWVDTGGTNVTMGSSLAKDLAIDLSGLARAGEHGVDTTDPSPKMSIGGIALDVDGMHVSLHQGQFVMPGIAAELVLPARSLRRLHVVFDYPERSLTIAAPGALRPRGVAVPCSVNPDTGLFMVKVTIDGEVLRFGVDTGSAGTWVSDKKTAEWAKHHSDWPRSTGAAGSTNFFGFPFESEGTLMSLPTMKVGEVPIDRETAVLGLSEQLFEWYSKKSASSVVGFLGADVIDRFRLEVDFPAQMSWWSPATAAAPRDLDIVGLTLRPEVDGAYTVAGVVSRNGVPVVEGVQPGDKLLRVDSLDTKNATMGAVVSSLRGEPGTLRTLLLERKSAQITVEVRVSHLP